MAASSSHSSLAAFLEEGHKAWPSECGVTETAIFASPFNNRITFSFDAATNTVTFVRADDYGRELLEEKLGWKTGKLSVNITSDSAIATARAFIVGSWPHLK